MGSIEVSSDAGTVSECTTAGGAASGSGTVSTVSSIAKAAPTGFFNCLKCKKQKSLVEISVRPNVCNADNNAYAALTKRWAKNRQLKVWWEGLSDPQQVDWYVKQSAHPSGVKRCFDELTYVETATTAIEHVNGEVDRLLPWKIFRRNGLMSGQTEMQLEKEFVDLTTNARAECRFVRGEWLVPEFQGMDVRKDKREIQAQVNMRSAVITSSEQLATLNRSGQILLENFATSCPQISMAPSTDGPKTDAGVQDQPVGALPINIILQQVHREVGQRTHTY
jgi:hypothetical protein